MDAQLVLLLYKNFGDSAVVVPSVPGVEITLSSQRSHATVSHDRSQVSLSSRRPHRTVKEE